MRTLIIVNRNQFLNLKFLKSLKDLTSVYMCIKSHKYQTLELYKECFFIKIESYFAQLAFGLLSKTVAHGMRSCKF